MTDSPKKLLLPASARDFFPLLKRQIHGEPLAYFDNASTTPKPESVLFSIDNHHRHHGGNIHRGVHTLSMEASFAYEAARDRIAEALHAPHREEIIFVRGTTEAINLVAFCFSASELKSGDEILLSTMEHHANIVPWQLHAVPRGVTLRPIPLTHEGDLDLDALETMIGPKTRLIAVSHASNVLGTINPIELISKIAHARGIPLLVDGAQALPHFPIDLQDLDCDFYAFSGHKMFGPTGIGVLYAKRRWLDSFPPFIGGGDMVDLVSFAKTSFQKPPMKFEAGTPPIAEVIGLAAAFDFLSQFVPGSLESFEQDLLRYTTEKLLRIPTLLIHGRPQKKVPLISFSLPNIHPHDLATLLDQDGIAIRAGNHCAQPLMSALGISNTSRISLAFYNTRKEIDRAIGSIEKAVQLFKV